MSVSIIPAFVRRQLSLTYAVIIINLIYHFNPLVRANKDSISAKTGISDRTEKGDK